MGTHQAPRTGSLQGRRSLRGSGRRLCMHGCACIERGIVGISESKGFCANVVTGEKYAYFSGLHRRVVAQVTTRNATCLSIFDMYGRLRQDVSEGI